MLKICSLNFIIRKLINVTFCESFARYIRIILVVSSCYKYEIFFFDGLYRLNNSINQSICSFVMIMEGANFIVLVFAVLLIIRSCFKHKFMRLTIIKYFAV